MGLHTKIQWCDSTLNLQMGCDGCELWNQQKNIRRCYAGVLTERMSRDGNPGWPRSFDQPQIFEQRIGIAERWLNLRGTVRPDKPWLDGYPRLVFLNDMGDSFTEALPQDWLAPFLDRLAATPHLYLLLTKRPRRAASFFKRFSCPKNLWLGTSLTAMQPGRSTFLGEINCPMRFISYEPAWGPINWDVLLGLLGGNRVHWIILGGESGPEAKPFQTDMIEEILPQWRVRGIAPFIKQLGSHPVCSNVNKYDFPEDVRFRAEGEGAASARILLKDSHGGDWSEWPEAWRVRELPWWKV